MKILVTGSEGFIGSYVVRRLCTLGHEVIGVDALLSCVHGYTAKPYPLYELHVRLASRYEVQEEFDAVVHLAARVGVGQSMYEPATYMRDNSHDTSILLENLTRKRPSRLVVASSMSVYGEGAYYSNTGELILDAKRDPGLVKYQLWELGNNCWKPAPTPESKPPDLRSIYALTKYDQEQLSLIWGRAHGVPTVALRFFNTYGPGQALQNPYTGALAIFATRLLNGKAPVLYEDGQQTRDFIYVEDVAEAVVRAATTPMEEGVYNVGTGVATPLERVARVMALCLGRPEIEPQITGKHRAGDIRHCYANISKLRATGWEPQVTLTEGLHHYAKWLRTQPLPVDRFDEAAKELEAAGLVR